MSGLYNTLFGQHANADRLLQLLGLTRDDVPRFRSCYWNGEHIVIHTRTGGGNREEYEDQNDMLTLVSGYVRDEDDDFDPTYADFYFNPPAEAAEALKALPAEITPAEQWQRLFAALDSAKSKSSTRK
jgi:hypothetical protein